jgi:hypothetical protein
MGNILLETIEEQPNLNLWFLSMGYTKIENISSWSEENRWIGWRKIIPPTKLVPHLDMFFKKLVGCALMDFNIARERWWNSSNYTVKKGYNSLLIEQPNPPYSKI